MFPLILTVEHEKGKLNNDTFETELCFGWAVIKLNGIEVKRIQLDYFHETEERESLEQAVAGWLAKNNEQ